MRVAPILVLLIACKATLPPYDYTKEPDPRNKELVLGVGDVLSINVWGEKDLNTDATIRPDGTITMPLVGDLKAGGETPSALKMKIKDQLARFVKLSEGTEITVAVKAWKSYRFTMSGEVGKPGVYTSDQYVDVGEAIAMAGGLTRFARRDGMRVQRIAGGKIKDIPLDYDDLASGKRPDMNIIVLPGDTIYVP
jgi:polysaccharide export outer membrane protein